MQALYGCTPEAEFLDSMCDYGSFSRLCQVVFLCLNPLVTPIKLGRGDGGIRISEQNQDLVSVVTHTDTAYVPSPQEMVNMDMDMDIKTQGAGELVLRVAELIALVEDLSSVPGTHMFPYNHPYSHCRDLVLSSKRTPGMYLVYMQAKHSFMKTKSEKTHCAQVGFIPRGALVSGLYTYVTQLSNNLCSKIFTFNCVCLCAGASGGRRSPAAGVKGNCEKPHMGAVKQTWIFCKSSVSHHFSPRL